MSVNPHKILLAVDGSAESLAVVRYTSKIVSPKNSEITLFYVIRKVPEIFWDLEKDPAWREKIEAVRLFQEKQEGIIGNFIQSCIKIFSTAGFSPDSVVSRIGSQNNGIARDIVAEVQRGYDVLVIGRGKSGAMANELLGGVASKILNAVQSPAVWLIGAVPSPSAKILIALDSSENSMRAVKHAGKIAGNTDSTITLFHAVRGLSLSGEGLKDLFFAAYRQSLLKEAEKEALAVMKLAQAKLVKMDISPERLSTRVVTGVGSRAAAILAEAEAGNYDTIVVGRRGVSEVLDFSMGRVTNKLTQITKQDALWIVG